METRSERRRRKLEALCAERGLKNVATKSGQNWQSLDQIIKGVLLPKKKDGSQSPRSLGDVAAQAIEDALNLGRGWFDADDSAAPPQVKEALPSYGGVSARDRAVLAAVYAVFSETEIEEIRLKAMEKLTADAALLRQSQADVSRPDREQLLNPPAQQRGSRAR